MRLVLAPTLVFLCAVSFLNIDCNRRGWSYGWMSPAMNEHWERLWDEHDFHAAKNVLVEWTRLDPQRAAKLFSFLLTVSVLVNILQAIR